MRKLKEMTLEALSNQRICTTLRSLLEGDV
jgi:hypothetical protein